MKNEKGEKNRGEKLFDKIVYSVEFQKGIKTIRKKFDISDSGFSNMKEVYGWYYPKDKSWFNPKIRGALLENISSLLFRQKLPNNKWWQQKIWEYIFTNGEFSFLPRTYPTESFVEVINKNTDFAKANISQRQRSARSYSPRVRKT